VFDFSEVRPSINQSAFASQMFCVALLRSLFVYFSEVVFFHGSRAGSCEGSAGDWVGLRGALVDSRALGGPRATQGTQGDPGG